MGSGRFNYLVSGSYFDQKGIILGSSYSRANGRVNLDFQATDKLSVTTSVSIAQEVNNRIESDNSIASAGHQLHRQRTLGPGLQCRRDLFRGRFLRQSRWGWRWRTARRLGPSGASGTVLADYSVLPWLRATGRAGFDILNLRENRYDSPLIPWTYAAGADGHLHDRQLPGTKAAAGGVPDGRSVLSGPTSSRSRVEGASRPTTGS